MRTRESTVVREPHSIDAAKDRRYDQNAIEMFCDRKRFINLCQLKIHQTFIFREHFLFFRWNARKRAISLRPAALDEYIESSANGFLVVVDDVISTFTTSLETITTTIIVTPALGTTTKEISLYSRRKTHKLPSKVFLLLSHPSVCLSHSISLPRRPAVLERRVYSVRVLPFSLV